MQELFRKIIWQQNYEIEVMKEMIGKLPFPIGIGNLYSFCSEINSNKGFPAAFDADSIEAIVTV